MSYRPKVKTDTSGNTQDFGLDADTVDGKHASDLQDKLVSGTNIKTINGNSVLGSGNLSITADDLKARYHLGAFDTVNGNTITRQTGYATSKDFGYNSSLNAYVYISKGYSSNSENVKANISLPYSYNWSGDSSHWYYESNNYVFIVIASDLQDVYIQYKLATSYTEKVIEGQPLNTLDQAGSNWLKDEWNKGLNLFSAGSQTVVANNETYKRNQVEIYLKQGTYTLSSTYSGTYHEVNVRELDNTVIAQDFGSGNPITFTITSDETYSIWFFASGETATTSTTTYSNIMLNEGDHAYPYQEYNGDIIHEASKLFVKGQESKTSSVPSGDYNMSFLLENTYIGSFHDSTDGWQNLINIRHRNGQDDGNVYGMQMRVPMTGNSDLSLYYRKENNGTWSSWKRIATADDLGSYLPLAGGTLTGTLTGNTGYGLKVRSSNTGSWKEGLRIYQASNNYAVLALTDNDNCDFVTALVQNSANNLSYLERKNSNGQFIMNIPNKTGTIAMTSDIPSLSGYATETWVGTYYLPLSGGSIKGKLYINPSYDTTQDSYNEGIRINKASNGWAEVLLGGDADSTIGTGTGVWAIARRGAAGSITGAAGDLTIEHNGSQGGGLTLYADGSKPRWNNNTLAYTSDIKTKDSDLTNDRYVRFDTNAQGLNSTQKSNARTNIGAGTSNFSGAYNDLSGKPTNLVYTQQGNDMIFRTNEISFVPSGYNDILYINYRTVGDSTNGNITDYYFCNGGGTILKKLSELAQLTLLWEGSTTGNITGLDTSYSLYLVSTYWGVYVVKQGRDTYITAKSYLVTGELDLQCLQLSLSSSGTLSWSGRRAEVYSNGVSGFDGSINGIYAVYGLK